MAYSISVVDEVLGNARGAHQPAGAAANRLTFLTPKISLRELIRFRVEETFNRQRQELYSARSGAPVERRLNVRSQPRRYDPHWLVTPDAEDLDRAVATALKGFQSNAYFVLADDRQVDALDDMLDLDALDAVTFVRLTGLKGG